MTHDDDIAAFEFFADLDGNGVRDAVLAGHNVDGVWTMALLLGQGSIEVAAFASKVPVWERFYVRDPYYWTDACLPFLLPKPVRLPSGSYGISIAYGEQTSSAHCRDPTRKVYAIENGRLVAIP